MITIPDYAECEKDVSSRHHHEVLFAVCNRLEELLRQMCQASKAIENTELEKFETTATSKCISLGSFELLLIAGKTIIL
ncbi:hypothetical protein OS493_021578 [Desmophyllum pertusum]|uniref:Uncharacterized protein n=1 Tax=Desmophyllum pertusum TaxID=174260 RepID=A0A9X0CJG9_9CNID|nr:hypothetical protein OS493_021578 [Desmophyllum pertusum]